MENAASIAVYLHKNKKKCQNLGNSHQNSNIDCDKGVKQPIWMIWGNLLKVVPYTKNGRHINILQLLC